MTMNSSTVILDNISLYTAEVPEYLMHQMLTEVSAIEKNEEAAERARSGLSSPGVPKHYRLSDLVEQQLKKFVMDCTLGYRETSYYLKTFDQPHVAPEYYCERPWINFQRAGEFIPNHIHGGVLSYTIWLRIPDCVDHSSDPFSGQFEFTYTDILGRTQGNTIYINKHSQGKIMLFPSSLRHCVYPFHNIDQLRVSLSGNVFLGQDPSLV